MQVRTVTASFIFSKDCTYEMLQELALHKDFGAMSQDAVSKLAKQVLKKGSNGTGAKQAASGDLPNAKLRTVLVQKLQDSPTQGEVFKAGNMQFEFAHLQDPDIGKAGANKQQKARQPSGKLSGAYVVVKQGVKCTADSDPGKDAIWQHVWSSKTFEEYFEKAPKKGVTKTGRVITATSEILWAVKSKWIKPVVAEQDAQKQEAPKSAEQQQTA